MEVELDNHARERQRRQEKGLQPHELFVLRRAGDSERPPRLWPKRHSPPLVEGSG